MGVLEVLFIVFVVLKLLGLVAWSWVAVCAPLYPAAMIWAVAMGYLSGIDDGRRSRLR